MLYFYCPCDALCRYGHALHMCMFSYFYRGLSFQHHVFKFLLTLLYFLNWFHFRISHYLLITRISVLRLLSFNITFIDYTNFVFLKYLQFLCSESNMKPCTLHNKISISNKALRSINNKICGNTHSHTHTHMFIILPLSYSQI